MLAVASGMPGVVCTASLHAFYAMLMSAVGVLIAVQSPKLCFFIQLFHLPPWCVVIGEMC